MSDLSPSTRRPDAGTKFSSESDGGVIFKRNQLGDVKRGVEKYLRAKGLHNPFGKESRARLQWERIKSGRIIGRMKELLMNDEKNKPWFKKFAKEDAKI